MGVFAPAVAPPASAAAAAPCVFRQCLTNMYIPPAIPSSAKTPSTTMTAIAHAGKLSSSPLFCNTPVGVTLTEDVTLSPLELVVVSRLFDAAVDSTDCVDRLDCVIDEYNSLLDAEIEERLAIDAVDKLETDDIIDSVACAVDAVDALDRLDLLLAVEMEEEELDATKFCRGAVWTAVNVAWCSSPPLRDCPAGTSTA